MIDDCKDCYPCIVADITDRRDCDALERTIEVPMLKPMRITGDDRHFIAV